MFSDGNGIKQLLNIPKLAKQNSLTDIKYEDDPKKPMGTFIKRSYSALDTLKTKLIHNRFTRDHVHIKDEIVDVQDNNEKYNNDDLNNIGYCKADNEKICKEELSELNTKLKPWEKHSVPWLKEIKEVQSVRSKKFNIEDEIKMSIAQIQKLKTELDDQTPPILPPKKCKAKNGGSDKSNSSDEGSPNITVKSEKSSLEETISENVKEFFDFKNVFTHSETLRKPSPESSIATTANVERNLPKPPLHLFKSKGALSHQKPPIPQRNYIISDVKLHEEIFDHNRQEAKFNKTKDDVISRQKQTLETSEADYLIVIENQNILKQNSQIVTKPFAKQVAIDDTLTIKETINIDEDNDYEEFDFHDIITEASAYLQNETKFKESLIAETCKDVLLQDPANSVKLLTNEEDQQHSNEENKDNHKIRQTSLLKQELNDIHNVDNQLEKLNILTENERHQLHALKNDNFQKHRNNISLLFDSVMELQLLLQQRNLLQKITIDELEMKLAAESDRITVLETEVARLSSK